MFIDSHARAGGTRLIIPRAARMIDERSRFVIVDSRYDVSPGAVLVTAWPIAYRAHIRKPASKKRESSVHASRVIYIDLFAGD